MNSTSAKIPCRAAGAGADGGTITGGGTGAVADRAQRGTGALIGSVIGTANDAFIDGELAQTPPPPPPTRFPPAPTP